MTIYEFGYEQSIDGEENARFRAAGLSWIRKIKVMGSPKGEFLRGHGTNTMIKMPQLPKMKQKKAF